MLADTTMPTWEVIASLWLHFMVAITLVVFERCQPDTGPLIDPNDVTVIQLAAVKQYAPQQQLPTRAPDPPPAVEPAPKPTPDPTPPPPTPASEMVLPAEKDEPDPPKEPPKEEPPKEEPPKEPPKGDTTPKDNTDQRSALLDNLKNTSVDDPNVRIGQQDLPAAGPDGVEGAEATIVGIGNADPVLAKYILACREAILPNWTPLPSLISAHPEYVVVVQATVAEDGTLGPAKIVKRSGDNSFDRSAILALAKTRKVPPPPAEWRASAAKGVQFKLAAADK